VSQNFKTDSHEKRTCMYVTKKIIFILKVQPRYYKNKM